MEHTGVRKDSDSGAVFRERRRAPSNAPEDVSRDTVHGSIGGRISNVLELLAIVIDEKREVRVLYRIPLVQLWDGDILALEKVFHDLEVNSDILRDLGREERHTAAGVGVEATTRLWNWCKVK